MKTKIAALAVALVTALAFGAGAALARPQEDGPPTSHDRMHSSEQMRAMHAEMSPDAQAECDAMHVEMPAAPEGVRGHRLLDERHPLPVRGA